MCDQGESQQQRLDPWRGVRTLRAGLHRRTLSADRWRPGVRVMLATWCWPGRAPRTGRRSGTGS